MRLARILALLHGLGAAAILVMAGIVTGRGEELFVGPLFLAAVVALSALFGGLLGRWLTRPLRHFTDVARPQAPGAQGRPPLPLPAPREMHELDRVLRDLQGRVQAQVETLRRACTRHEEILDSITEGILVTDDEGRILMTNQALGLLFDISHPVAGRRPVEVIRHTPVSEAIDHVLENRRPTAREVVLRGPSQRHLDLHVAPIMDAGQFVGTVTVFYEITRLRRLERTRADFVANVSHELRTPLTAIKGCAETLADGALSDPSAATRFVGVIRSHADRLTSLLSDLLDLSRLEAAETRIVPQRHGLERIIDTAREALGRLAADRQIEVRVEMPAPVDVCCDRRLIEQALINLTDNAIKYTPAGGRVTIRARRRTRAQATEDLDRRDWRAGHLEPGRDGEPGAGTVDAVVVEVADSGIGIPSEEVERVFERFYRVHKGRSRALGGTGLGLSIVRHIVDLHGECVFVDSELEKGSTFGFTLPAAGGPAPG